MKRFFAVALVMTLTAGFAVAGKPGFGKNNGHRNNGHKNTGIRIQFPINKNQHRNIHQHSNGGFKNGFRQSFNGYHLTHGKSFGNGWKYVGRSHNHWTRTTYCPKYRCTCYWCPSTNCYYYWNQSAGCYYPYSYLSRFPHR